MATYKQERNILVPLMMLLIGLLAVLLFTVYLNHMKIYSLELQEQGYCKEWADHKAKVEFYLAPADSLYQAIEED